MNFCLAASAFLEGSGNFATVGGTFETQILQRSTLVRTATNGEALWKTACCDQAVPKLDPTPFIYIYIYIIVNIPIIYDILLL